MVHYRGYMMQQYFVSVEPNAEDWPNAGSAEHPTAYIDHDGFAVTLYENRIPWFLSDAMERKYRSIYCVIRRMQLYESIRGASAYISTKSAQIDTILLFRITGRAVYVLNQQIHLNTEQIVRFCKFIFMRYGIATRIEFYALDTIVDRALCSFVYQEISALEEQVIVLPKTEAAYLQGSSARLIRRWLAHYRKLETEHPSCRFEVRLREAIEPRHVRALVGLTEKRMQFKHRSPYIKESEIELLVELARTHGCMGLIYIGDELCAGSLGYIAGDRCFLRMTGHDPKWNAYALGNTVQVKIILHCISKGMKEVLLMGGGSDAKARLLAKKRMYNSLTIYRSRQLPVHDWKRYAENKVKLVAGTCKHIVTRKANSAGISGRAMKACVDVAKSTRAALRASLRAATGCRSQNNSFESKGDRSGSGM